MIHTINLKVINFILKKYDEKRSFRFQILENYDKSPQKEVESELRF